jgi:glycosyltransferase involved in cell wall biosynthesis
MGDCLVMDPQLTVILPVYNAEPYLKECLASLQLQTFRDFEVLIFDDASTDRSHGILMAFDDPRFHVERSRQNQGYAVYLNQGIEKARGRYIARMDADDICHPDRFQKQVDFLEKNREVGICGSAYEVFGDAETKIFQKPADDEAIRWMLMLDNPFQHPTVMMRRSVLIDHGLRYREDLTPTEDYELWSRLLKVTKGANLQEPLLRYRFHGGQETSARRGRQLEIHERVAIQNIKEFSKESRKAGKGKRGGLDVKWGIQFRMNALKAGDDPFQGLVGYWDLVRDYFSVYPNAKLEQEERKRIGKFLVSRSLSMVELLGLMMVRPSFILLWIHRLVIHAKKLTTDERS